MTCSAFLLATTAFFSAVDDAIVPERVTPAASVEHEAVLYDTTHGATLWAVGANYKAGFDVDGAQFVPFLGSAAPRNYPLQLVLEGARIGDRALELAADVEPRLEDGFVRYDRGPLVEVYRTDVDAIEQLFRFAEHPGVGELVLRVAWSSDLVPTVDAKGIRFDGEHGGVRYGKAVAFDARGSRVDAPVVLEDDVLVIRVPAEFLEKAVAPITVDPLVTTIAIDLTPAVDSTVDVSHDGSLGVYFVTWQRTFSVVDIDVYGRIFDAVGTPRGDFIVDASPQPLTRPSNAGIEVLDRFFVVGIAAMENIEGAVVGRIVDLSSGIPVVGPLKTLYPDPRGSVDVGGDAGVAAPHHFVIATSFYYSTYGFDTSFVQAATPDGDLLPPFYFFNFDGDAGRFNPLVSKRAAEPGGEPRYWHVIYVDDDFGSTSVRGLRLRADMSWFGVPAYMGPGETEAVSSALEPATGAPVAMVVTTYDFPTITLSARVFGGAPGALFVGPSVQLQPAPGVECVDASADSDGSNFVVTYTARYVPGVDERVIAETYALEGLNLVLTERVELSISPGVHRGSAVTSTRGGGAPQRFFAAWRDETSPDGNILGALYDTPGPGVRYCTAAPNSVGAGAALRASGSISIQENSFALHASGAPPGQAGLFYLGENAVSFPFGEGFRCIGGDTRRIFPVTTIDGAGNASAQLDFGQPYGVLAQPGGPGVNYQFWYRDPSGGPATFNLSDALHVEHLP